MTKPPAADAKDSGMLQRLRQSLDVARPRSITRMQKSLEDVVQTIRWLRLAIKEQGERDKETQLRQQRDRAELAARIAEMNGRITELTKMIQLLTLRESQLRAIATTDAAFADAFDDLAAVCDEHVIVSHVRDAVARSHLVLEPLPYLIISNVFPPAFYDALIRAIPPVELFADKPRNKQQLKVPLMYGPAYSRAVWTFLVDVALERSFQPAIIDKFREPLGEWIAREWPQLASNPLGPPMELHSTDGRILLRRRGYRIQPHRDPKWGFITVLLYLPRRGDSDRWGTQIYAVDEDPPANTISPHWIDPERCRLAADVPFRSNSALVFLNSRGAHGASIPDDAEPADLQRYIYQFRIGPTKAAIEALVTMLPPHRRAEWEGKLIDYLA
jgi:hypothetical protein